MSATDLNAVRSADPSFDADEFLVAATALFRDVRSAYSQGHLDTVAGRISPGLVAIFDRQSRFLTSERTMSAIDSVTAELHGIEMASDGELRTVVRFDVTGRLGVVALSADVPPATQLTALPTRHWSRSGGSHDPAASPPRRQQRTARRVVRRSQVNRTATTATRC